MTKINEYKDKKGNTLYRFRFYAGIDELTGKKKYIKRASFKTIQEAKKELLKIEYEVSQGIYFNKVKSMKFEDVMNEWLAVYKTTVKASTYDNNLMYINNYIHPYFKDMRIDKIKLVHCQDFINRTFKTTPTGTIYAMQIVKRIFNYAIRSGIIESNPVLYVVIPKQKQSIERVEHENFYNRDELKTFLDTAKKYNEKYYNLVRLLAYTGMRKGEALALTWDDVDFTNNTISVSKTVAKTNKGYTIQTPKTKASNRVINVDQETLISLKKWQIEQRKIMFALGFNVNTGKQLVFSNRKNTILNGTLINHIIKKLAKKSDLYAITPHGFRHTHASLLFDSGMNVKQVQKRLGHSNINTTLNIYTHVVQTEDKTGDEFAKYLNLG
ncbi:phage integrase [Ligilactobacillus hayakitensis DSM 18933 = JCM 14209]|uniref:Phage integrase n=1 Tax=Ligilactobacillus hayakitensis DSM 18933 = JCM 14209 TaxID=1423755 RepID=A0A0R1WN94_9LACO|nr:tyrosine-type recombinase/integrase [Ligilactobacillus hayakitensis]KRM18925.1 phage integrase [Ligilactobacillus hayakitensis DSM 18933 = JCM 14209]